MNDLSTFFNRCGQGVDKLLVQPPVVLSQEAKPAQHPLFCGFHDDWIFLAPAAAGGRGLNQSHVCSGTRHL